MEEVGVLVVGAGLAGMAAARAAGPGTVVVEREDRPGGTVRSASFDGFWFDHVVHVLHFQDPVTEALVRALPDLHLAPCVPDAWVVTKAGVARFPIQHHLGHLEPEAVIRCLVGMIEAAGGAGGDDYETLLRRSFGDPLCEIFFAPYNRKMWRRPLASLAPDGLRWNIHRPGLERALRGALYPDDFRGDAYNAHAFYPRPPRDAPVRGMETLSRALAAGVPDLRCGRELVALEPADRVAVLRSAHGEETLRWERACVSTVPLPRTVRACGSAPADLVRATDTLVHNIVISVAVRVRGPRPDLGHWRYYPDESLVFTRLVFLHAFDPDLAPPDGWPLLVEVPWRAEDPVDLERVRERVVTDVERTGVLGEGRVEGADVILVDPAYACFTQENRPVMEACRSYLREAGIEPLGRYGRWEYSSMAQVLRDGFAAGEAISSSA